MKTFNLLIAMVVASSAALVAQSMAQTQAPPSTPTAVAHSAEGGASTGERENGAGTSPEYRRIRKGNHPDGRHHARAAAGGRAQARRPQGRYDCDCELPGGAGKKCSDCTRSGGSFGTAGTQTTRIVLPAQTR